MNPLELKVLLSKIAATQLSVPLRVCIVLPSISLSFSSAQGETSERILQSGTRSLLPFLQSNEEVISSGWKVLTKDLIKCLQMCVISKVFNSCNAKQFHTECAYKIPFNHCRALFYCSPRSIITLFFSPPNLQHHESWNSYLRILTVVRFYDP